MLRTVIGALALSAAALAQQTFEVASVKPSAPSDGANPAMAMAMARAQDGMYNAQARGWLPVGKGRLTLKNRPLAGLIASAYRVRTSEVSGPSWMADARFEIEATLPEGTKAADVNEMLRALLEERFGLKAHREDKEVAGYALVEAKGGAKLASAAEQPKAEEGQPPDPEARRAQMDRMMAESRKRTEELRQQAAADGVTGGFNRNSWNARNKTLAEVADWLAAQVGKPVVDATGIEGKHDLELELVRFGDDTPEHAANQALAKFGLKLESRKVTVATVVVDQVERTPKEN
jgi:uncharacterized protein (TIGR03435 family)